MSSTTPNIGLTKTTAAETIGQNWAASNDSGGNFDIIDTKMGAVGNTSVQAQLDALNSQLTQIYKTTVSGTLSSGGSISSGLQNKAILATVIKDSSAAKTGVVSYSTGGVPWITVCNIANMTPIGAETVSIDIYYCDFK